MIVPAKYQSSNYNDPDNSSRINNITKKYIACLKKFSSSLNNTKPQTSKENQVPTFKSQVLEWFFKLSYIDRIKVSTINNKWVFQTLHQLYTEQKKKENLKFIPSPGVDKSEHKSHESYECRLRKKSHTESTESTEIFF